MKTKDKKIPYKYGFLVPASSENFKPGVELVEFYNLWVRYTSWAREYSKKSKGKKREKLSYGEIFLRDSGNYHFEGTVVKPQKFNPNKAKNFFMVTVEGSPQFTSSRGDKGLHERYIGVNEESGYSCAWVYVPEVLSTKRVVSLLDSLEF